MTSYSAHWRTTIFVSIILHFILWYGFAFIFPYLMPKPKVANDLEMIQVNVDLVEDESVKAEESQPIETSSEPEFVLPEYEFPTIKIPDLSTEPAYIEPVRPKPIPIEQPKIQRPTPKFYKDKSDAPKQVESVSQNSDTTVVTNQEGQQMGQPPVTVKEFYPPQGSGLDYKGYVIVSVTIGKDGKVLNANVIYSSGRLMVDNIAMNAAEKWIFKPALDQNGKPMACDKIITFDFKELA